MRLAPGTSWRRTRRGEGELAILRVRDAALRIPLARGLGRAFRRLSGAGGTAPALAALARGSAGTGRARWAELLERLESAGALCYEVHDAGGLLARLVPMTPAYREAFLRRERAQPLLSRFSCLRRTAEGLRLESPLSHARVELAPRALPLLAPLTAGRRSSGGASRALLALLGAAGLLTRGGQGALTEEDADPVLAGWEFADLLFHARSRMGRHDGPVGGTFEQLGRSPPLPAVKPSARSNGHGAVRRIALPRPSLTRLERRDISLTRALERRRSIRPRSAAPLTLAQLGEFLFRTARVRSLRPAGRGLRYETTRRPYPSGGACYPLELYLAVSRCRGLSPGLYHYDPLRHRLEEVPGGSSALRPLLRDTRQALGPAAPLLIMLTARFARLSWKYRAMAYSTLLKDVGALMQTMYLVATAMGLAPCAVGCGDADRSARVLGTDYAAESSVGEFLLGGPAKGGRRGSR